MDEKSDSSASYTEDETSLPPYQSCLEHLQKVPHDQAYGGQKDQQRAYDDQLDNVANTVGRGIQAGSMIAFGSSNSTKMANLIVEAFDPKIAVPKSLKGVRVVFIGAPADEQRVRDIIAPTEADFVFVEAK